VCVRPTKSDDVLGLLAWAHCRQLERRRRGFRPLRAPRAVTRRARRGRRTRGVVTCKPFPAPAQDPVTGWLIYFCTKGVLLAPTQQCVGPECQGQARRNPLSLGFAGDLAAGTDGSFAGARRATALRSLTGVEAAQGLNVIEQARRAGELSDEYARYAAGAYRREPERYTPLLPAFQGPGPFQNPVAAGAFGRLNRVGGGLPVGPSVREGCACKPRKPDAIDPVSLWLIYYVPGGVLLTPTEKCIGYFGKPRGFWSQMWRGAVELVEAVTARFAPSPVPTPAPTPAPVAAGAPPAPEAPEGKKLLGCYNPNIWPPALRECTGDPNEVKIYE
jgi:hypothetical protein